MPDLIDRGELKNRLKWGWANDKFVLRTIDEMPTAEAEPVKHGRWIFEEHPDSYYYHWECSNCKAWFSDNARFGYNYCPNCGAKMDMEGEE